MKHYGDITKINGSLVEPVNVVIGGSPCQDLSVAGKQAGLAGERSGLFIEQLRIIKEMRRADLERGRTGKDTRPRYMVWENVPGAFSSNKGADFSIVLQETAKVACEQAPAVPIPKNGWPPAGCLTDVGGQWSIAWRVFDAQFWGVPQRRKRIALVADFGGLTAPEILFERQGVPGYIKPCGKEGQATPGNIETCFNTAGSTRGAYCIQGNCIDRADTAGCNGKGWTEGVSYTLNTIDRHAVLPFEHKAFGICSYSSNSMKSSNPHSGIYEADTSKTLDLNCGNPACNQGGIVVVTPFVLAPLTDGEGQSGDNQPTIALEHHPMDSRISLADDGIVQTLNARMGTGECSPRYVYDPRFWNIATPEQPMFTLLATSYKEPPVVIMEVHNDNVCEEQSRAQYIVYIARRLTPLECERLQGFPDGWTDIGEWTDSKGKVHKESTDSARYKALGNSIAIPPWTYVLQRLSLCCGAKPTMASLFDGIGGFPYIWESLNGRGSCVWASEIEDFPIAVTKYHFPEEVTNDG